MKCTYTITEKDSYFCLNNEDKGILNCKTKRKDESYYRKRRCYNKISRQEEQFEKEIKHPLN